MITSNQPIIDVGNSAVENDGYLMIDQLDIRNFRCFQQLSLSGLRRINIVVGKNASGKTALLEAIRAGLAATPGVFWQISQARMFGIPISMGPTKEHFENIWAPYFYNFDSSQPITADFHDSSGRRANLRVFYDTEKAVLSFPEQPSLPPSNIAPLVFERVDFEGKKSRLTASIAPQGNLQMESGPELGVVSEFYTSANPFAAQQSASFFSMLSVNNREREIVDAMRDEFSPLIEDLTVLSPYQFPVLYAVVPGFKEKIPLSLLSSGINKLFGILAAMIVRSNGVILIDEIENGLYHDRLESIWRVIFNLSKKYNTQVFASTHSAECLRAVTNVMANNEEEFALLRAEHEDTGANITKVDGPFLESALTQGFEVR